MGYQIIEPSVGSTDWGDFSTIVNYSMKGFMGLSLTNYDTTDVPLIAPGSRLEVAGSIFFFSTSETITGSLSTEQNYIMVTTSSSSITASYTTDVPVWVPSKNAWYDSSTGVQRYIGGCSTAYGNKWIYSKNDSIEYSYGSKVLRCKILEIGDWDMDTDGAKNVVHGIADHTKIRSINVLIREDSGLNDYVYNIFTMTATAVTGGYRIDSTNIALNRVADSVFDGVLFDETSYNRGWITIWYEA